MLPPTLYAPLLLVAVLFLGSTIRSGESFAPNSATQAGTQKTSALHASATFEDYRKAFPENPNIVAAGGWNNLETLSQNDPKQALVDFVVSGLKEASAAVEPAAAKSVSAINEQIEALSLLLYSMGKGFAADTIDGEWDLVFTKQGTKSPSFQKIVGKTETAGKSKNIFDISSMVFHGDVSFWKWGKVSTSVKYTPTSDDFSKSMDGKIVVRKIVCNIINAFFKWWKLPKINFPLPKKTGFLEVVYLDEDIRVTKGNRGGFFVHFRPAYLAKVMAA